MPSILSVAEAVPPFVFEQQQAMEFAAELFSESFKDIGRKRKMDEESRSY